MPKPSPQPLIFHSRSEDDSAAFGRALGRLLQPGDVLTLEGQLGAGKTFLTRAIAHGLGIDPAAVSSPTFVLMHIYPAADPARPALIHIDAYRLSADDDAESLGLDRAFNAGAAAVIEWPSRAPHIAELLAPSAREHRADITIDHTARTHRRFTLAAPAPWRDRAAWAEVEALAALPANTPPPGSAVCPITGQPVHPDAPTFPFANEQARLADLNRWFSGGYTLSRDLAPDDLDDPDLNRAEP